MPADPRKIEPQVLACRRTADGVEIDLRIDGDLAPLAGHFPGLPVVPGVCLLDWSSASPCATWVCRKTAPCSASEHIHELIRSVANCQFNGGSNQCADMAWPVRSRAPVVE
jgi:3-hydroxymyristoyl/3-hydroxydecanoyl-(acyl carrier protein) dehydratase